MKDFWQGLTPRARIGLMLGMVLIVVGMGVTSWWLLRTDYQVLFAELKPQDASAMTAELERLKIPYQVGDNGAAILVDKAAVHTTRIKLMGQELALHGAVGFELFNNTDFGMTEFAQKINYQRALQGELMRTILALSEIRDVRVHLALPEQGLFKQASSKAKAAVTLTLRQGQALRAEQVTGIARLVAAAVPGMASQDVTIVDNQGVVLNRPSGDNESEGNGARLDLKRETEAYLSRKAGAVLERAFGPGQALASVDVSLNMDQVRVTTEEVLPAQSSARGNQAPTGVVVRERESGRDGGAPLDVKGVAEPAGIANLRAPASNGSTQREVEYQVGRRVEQVVSQPGSIRRIQAVAVLRHVLDAAQEERVRKMVAAAVGASSERGDTVVVQTYSGVSAQGDAGAGISSAARTDAGATSRQDESAATPVQFKAATGERSSQAVTFIAVLMMVVILVGALVIFRARVASPATGGTPAGTRFVQPLTEAQREAAMRKVHDWMRDEGARRAPASPVTTGGGAV